MAARDNGRDSKRTLGIRDKKILYRNAKGRCENPPCGKRIDFDEMQVGHKTSWSKRGRTNLANSKCLCWRCNNLQGADSWATFLKKQKVEDPKVKVTQAELKVLGKPKRGTNSVVRLDEVETYLTKKAPVRTETEENEPFEFSLPLNVDYAHAIHLDLANKEKVKTSAKLEWIPFFRVSYKVNCRYSDPSKTPHPIIDEGVYTINAYTKTLGEEEETLIFKKELEKTPAENQSFGQTGEYQVIKLPTRMTKGQARALATDYVIQKHTAEPIWYDVPSAKKKRRDDLVIFDFDGAERIKWTLKPLKKDVRIREIQIVYAPKWEIDFESKDYKYYKKRLSGNTGTVFEDNITYCSKQSHEAFFGSRKKNVAVCDVCGQFLCQEHIFKCPTCNSWLCEKDSIQCAGCKKRFCADHIKYKCFKCSLDICDGCALKCPICGEIHCNAHMTQCSRCGKSVCVSFSCTRKEGGLLNKKTVCKNC